MNDTKRVYILNHGEFNHFGYSKLAIPAVVDLTEEQIAIVTKMGYKIEIFSSDIPVEGVNKPIRSMSVHELLRRTQNR